MRQVVIEAPTRFAVVEADVPKLQSEGDLILRTEAAGICSGDLMEWYLAKKVGTVFGHEFAGEVVAVGAAVPDIRPGQRVFAHHHAPCGVCRFCRAGAPVQCATWKKSHVDPGGMAEFVRIPQENVLGDCFAIDDLSAEAGVFIEPLACSVKALWRGQLQAGQTVAVIGCGIMGMLNIAAARAFGATHVWAIEPDPWRRGQATRLGATAGLTPAEILARVEAGDFPGADLVVVGPGHPGVIRESLRYVRPGGVVVLFTPTATGVVTDLDVGDLYFKDISLVPSYSCGPKETREAYRLLRSGAVDIRPIITHRFPLDAFQTAFETAKAGGSALKVMIEFGSR